MVALHAHQEDTAYLCLHFTKNHEELKSNTPYPEDPIRRIDDYLKILEDIKRGSYSKKPPIRRIDLNQYGVSMKLSKTRSLDYLNSSGFNLSFDPEDQFEEEETETMGEPTIEEYMTRTREGYSLRIATPKIDEKA
ncbi:hypothetical protein Tco_0493206 [Tanacetum coccineum]